MAYSSKCPSCPSNSFEISVEVPKDSNFKLQFVRCTLCGTVVGVLEYFNIGALLRSLAKKMGISLD